MVGVGRRLTALGKGKCGWRARRRMGFAEDVALSATPEKRNG